MEKNRDIYKGTYIHPDSDEIRSFVLQIKKDTTFSIFLINYICL